MQNTSIINICPNDISVSILIKNIFYIKGSFFLHFHPVPLDGSIKNPQIKGTVWKKKPSVISGPFICWPIHLVFNNSTRVSKFT